MIRAFFLTFFIFLSFTGVNADIKIVSKKQVSPLPVISLGEKKAPVKVIMYYSLSCGHCREFAEKEFPHIKKELIDTGKVYWTYKDYPIDGPAVAAAQIAHCDKSEKYMKIAAHLLKHQDEWHVEDGWREKLIKVAEKTDLSVKEIEESLKDDDMLHAIFEDCLHARKKYGVNFAPAFVVNGKLFDPEGKSEMNFKMLQKIVSQEIESQKSKKS